MATNEDLVKQLEIIAEILSTKLDAVADAVEENTEERGGEYDRNLKFHEKAAKKLQSMVPGVESVITRGSKAIEEAVKQSFQIQKTALSRGMNLDKIVQRQAQSNNELAGNITGFSNVYQLEMEKFAGSMNSSSKEMDQLAMMTKLTGGDSKKLLKQMGKLNAGIAMSDEQNAKLGKTIQSMSQNYGMTTEELMGVIEGLDKSMPMFKLLGIAPEIAEATARLGAALGQEAGTMASDMIQALTSAEGMVLASQLGVADLRMSVLKKEGNVAQNSMKMVEAAGAEASRLYKQYMDGAADPAIAYKAVEDALGPSMAKAAMTYTQMEQEAAKMGKSVSDYVNEVANQESTTKEFMNTMDNFFSVAFAPLEEAATFLARGITKLTGLMENVFIRRLVQFVTGVGTAAIAIIAAIKAFKLISFGKKAAGGVKDAITSRASGTGGGGGGGGGIGKSLAGVGKGISKLGAGVANLGKGLGRAAQSFLTGVAKGIAAFGSPKVFKGALGVALVGASLLPMVFALKLMKGVGIKSILMLGGAILFFGTMMALTGAFLGPVIPMLAIGAGVFALIGAALIPLAFALSLVAKPLAAFSMILHRLAPLNPFYIALMGPALVSLSVGLAALAAGSVLGAVVNFFTGGQNPIEKLIELGKAAKDINKLADSLYALSPALEHVGEGLSKLDMDDVDKMKKVAEAASKVKPVDDITQTRFKPMGGDLYGTPGYSLEGSYNPATKTFSGSSEGVDQYDLDRAREAVAEHKATSGRYDDAEIRSMEREQLKMLEQTVAILESILGQNTMSAEEQRKAAQAQQELRDAMNRPPIYQGSNR